MKRGIEALVLTLMLTLAAGCAETGEETGMDGEADTTEMETAEAGEDAADVEAIRTETEAANAAFSDAMAAGDVEGAARNVYTEDAVIYPPGAEPISGREAIIEFWNGVVPQLGVTGVELTTVELQPIGNDMAWEVGEGRILGAEGQVLDDASYVVIWKSTPEGWRWHRDIWNSDGTAGAEEGAAAEESAPADAAGGTNE